MGTREKSLIVTDQKALDVAFSPESLSMAADQFADALQNVRRDLGRRLRVSRATIEGVEAEATLAAN